MSSGLQTFLFVLAGWIFSLCLHEYSHARLAYEGGDTSVVEKGYLSFNPLRYLDPVFSIVMPVIFLLIGGIGLPGGAVWIDRRRIRDPRWMSVVSAGGPLSNLLLAIVLALPFRLMPDAQGGLWPALAFLVLLQIMALVLNLIPIPPLDGYGIVRPFLPDELRTRMDAAAQWSFYLLFGTLWFVPQAGALFFGAVRFLAALLGVPPSLAAQGYQLFQFWK